VEATARSNLTDLLTGYCRKLPLSDCLNGVAADFKQCGFAFNSEYTAWCSKTPDDPCCSPNTARSVSSTGPNSILITGIAFAVLFVIGLLIFVYRKHYRAQNGPLMEPENPPKLQPRRNSPKAGSSVSKPFYHEAKDSLQRRQYQERQRLDTMQSRSNHKLEARPYQERQRFGTLPNRQNPRDDISFSTYQQRTQSKNQSFLNPKSKKFESYYSTANSPTSRMIQAVYDFAPSRDDEIAVSRGESLLVIETYDDAWAFGTNLKTGEGGLFPMAVAEPEPLSPLSSTTLSILRHSMWSSRTNSLMHRKSTMQRREMLIMKDFIGTDDDEIGLRKGDTVLVLLTFEDGFIN
jgi:hypothetical protein